MIHRRRTAVMIRWGSISWICGRVCEAHSLPKVQVLDQDSSGSETPMFMKLSAPLQQLYRHIGDVVPQPAHTSQTGARSVERAMGASHRTTGWDCKVSGQAADLVRLLSARRTLHREILGAVQVSIPN